MVGQTCRFAATTSRSSPTISEISFGNHSNSDMSHPAGNSESGTAVLFIFGF